MYSLTSSQRTPAATAAATSASISASASASASTAAASAAAASNLTALSSHLLSPIFSSPSSTLSLPHVDPLALRLGTFNVGLGFSRKLSSIVMRSLSLSLDVIAVQEIGDPSLSRHSSIFSQYFLITSPGPSSHEAGVGLLISNDLLPRCRTYKRSSSGRLVGVILELSKGYQTLIVSAYMPSGLDHCSANDPKVQMAHDLYREFISWTTNIQYVICMGDMNETLTSHDRYPSSSSSSSSSIPRHGFISPIHTMIDERFVDAYRSIYSDAKSRPGFTHHINSLTRCSRSRIDYIWIKGFIPPAPIQGIHIDHHSPLRQLSHHRLLWMTIHIPSHSHHHPPHPHHRYGTHHTIEPKPLLPNLKDVTKQEKEMFIHTLNDLLGEHDERLISLTTDPTHEPTLSSLASELTSITSRAAKMSFHLIGGKPFQSKTILKMNRMRRDITRLLHMAQRLHEKDRVVTRCADWNHLYQHCLEAYELRWSIAPVCVHIRYDDWCNETRMMIRDIRRNITRAHHRLSQKRHPRIDDMNRPSSIHKMLESDTLPSTIYSVVDSKGELTSSASEMEDVMVHHFESVFSIPPPDSSPLLPYPPPSILLDKPGIDPNWYNPLMSPPTHDELIQLVSDTPLVSAPGQDEVSPGVWKVAIAGSEMIRKYIIHLFTSCLSSSIFPSTWKTSIILPFVKDTQKERTMSNIRPISLQSCLGKLFNKLLARRLGLIFQQHPILNPSQRGFVLGGTTMKCIDELLDAWQWSREKRQELYTIFYDIKQAYDSVQSSVLARAMHRLHLPPSFITLIVDSLSNLTSSIRTIYGLTRSFVVSRSLRQGDPLAPLLFVILMDGLHDGLEKNPFTQQSHGCHISFPREKCYLPSLGYADDTTVLSNTLPDLIIQNNWVQFFMKFNLLRLNPIKCEVVGRRLDGTPLTEAQLSASGFSIDGRTLVPVPHNRPIRYLGIHACFDGSWIGQQQKSLAHILRFTRLVDKFNMSIGHAVYMYNAFLMPRLELSLHYVHGPGTLQWIHQCDKLIIGSIKHAAGSLLRLSKSCLTMALHLLLPSWLEQCIKVCELFLRMNSSDQRWGHLGRRMMRQQCPSSIDDTTPLTQPNSGTQLTRAVYLAVKSLRWSLHTHRESRRHDGRHQQLLKVPVRASLPTLDECSSTMLLDCTRGRVHVAHDFWSGWVALSHPFSQSDEIHVYTDGSHDQATSASSWSAVVGDRWFDENFLLLPSDEQELARQPAHVGGSIRFGSAVDITVGIYPVELQAIARALAMFPLNTHLHIHSDSQASIKSILTFVRSHDERDQLRSAGRPLLQLIRHLWYRRQEAGGRVTLSHVSAHTDNDDAHSVGNRLADFEANRARARPSHPSPINVRPLPIEQCEPYMYIKSLDSGMVIINDIRSSALQLIKSRVYHKWKSKSSGQEQFACDGMIDFGRIILKHGTHQQQQTFVHVASSTIHYHRVTDPNDHSSSPSTRLAQLECPDCHGQPLTLAHLMSCRGPTTLNFRRDLLHSILDQGFSHITECQHWLSHAKDHVDLHDLMIWLFPPSARLTSVDERHGHTIRCMIGAFTIGQSTSAISQLGIKDLKVGQSAFVTIRQVCLQHIGQFYHAIKQQQQQQQQQ